MTLARDATFDVAGGLGDNRGMAEALLCQKSYRRKREGGDLSDDDLAAAGLPGRASNESDGDTGFFTDLFRSLRSLV